MDTESATQPRTCLVIAAHPDDVESWAGGAAAGLARDGWRVVYLLCTSGDKGTSDPTEAPAQVAARRKAEQRAACAVIGAAEPEFLGLPDGELEDNHTLLRLLVAAIRRHKPALLLTHDAVTPWPPYTCHRDHRVVGRVALDAAYPYARDALSFPELAREQGLAPHNTPEVWLFCSAAPDHYVDISATLDVKIAARLEHRSQTSDAEALARDWRQRAVETGASAGLAAAEAFKRLRL